MRSIILKFNFEDNQSLTLIVQRQVINQPHGTYQIFKLYDGPEI